MNGFNLSNIQDARLGAASLSSIYLGSSKLWPTAFDYSQDPFTITSLSDNNTISIVSTLASDVRMYKWDPSDKSNTFVSTTLNANSTHTVGTLNTGDSYAIAIFSSSQFNIGKSTSEYINITATDNFKVSGNITTLLDEDLELFDSSTLENESYAFYHLFYNNTYLSDASNLVMPATTLADSCYREMFKGCSSLTSAPVLPATTLAENCYRAMFSGCALTDAPTLPATTLSLYCYGYMFENCKSLTAPPVLPATTLATYCYMDMFRGCKSLTSAPVLSATTLTDSCYREMFKGCSSLTSAPVLPATTLQPNCYRAMFSGCALTDAPTLPATTLSLYCYGFMFEYCTSLTAAPVLPATTLTQYCYGGMFKGCSSLTTAPELPATTLINYCYNNMFYGCSSLNYIKCLATNISASNSHNSWVTGVALTGTFVKPTSMTKWGGGSNGIPRGWTVVNV